MSSVVSEEDEDPPGPSVPHTYPQNHLPNHSRSSSSLPSYTSSEASDHHQPHTYDGPASSASDSDSSDDLTFQPLAAFSHNFAPPFYNRPPTPLPPSPSLTSLLRASRPTSPDASDHDDAPSSAPNSRRPSSTGFAPLRRGSYTTLTNTTTSKTHLPIGPVPRAAPKVPTYEYYGFVLYLLSSAAFFVYLLWSYVPSPILHALGIRYYPDRWWSLAIPAFLVVGVCYVYVALAAYNVEVLTLGLGSVETVVDESADVAVLGGGEKKKGRKGSMRSKSGSLRRGGTVRAKKRGEDWREVWCTGTDAVMDVPLAGVCEVLYGGGMDGDIVG